MNHGHEKRKDSRKKWAVLLIFLLELEISSVSVQRIHQNSRNWWLCEELLSENDFYAVLATFCCHNYGANISEALQKIATDQKVYLKCSSCAVVCRIAKICKLITVKQVCYLLTRTPPALQKKLHKLHRKRSNNWTMMGFIHSGNEITTWMGV